MSFNFIKWREKISSLNKYEDEKDSQIFLDLLDLSKNHIDENIIDVLLDTFSNDPDYGLQERVFGVLECAPIEIYAKKLCEKFQNIIEKSSENEWPLIIIGAEINRGDEKRILTIVSEAKQSFDNNNKSLYEFIKSDYFLDEYPEMNDFLPS